MIKQTILRGGVLVLLGVSGCCLLGVYQRTAPGGVSLLSLVMAEKRRLSTVPLGWGSPWTPPVESLLKSVERGSLSPQMELRVATARKAAGLGNSS